MAKPRKKAAAPEPLPMPQVGDKVTIPSAKSVLEITHVSHDGDEVNLQLPGTNLQWFRVRTDTVTFVNRKPPARTSNPFTTAEPTFDVDEVLERIRTVQEENLKRFDDAIDILKAYLQTQHVPKAAIETLEGLTVEQHVSWKKAIEKTLKQVAGSAIFCRHSPPMRYCDTKIPRYRRAVIASAGFYPGEVGALSKSKTKIGAPSD